MKPLLVVTTGRHIRLAGVMEYALQGLPYERADLDQGEIPSLRGRRVLFALSLGQYGLDAQICRLIVHLRQHPGAMEGSCGALLIDGDGELYTKQLAHMLALCANGAGCFFPGKPLVEGTGSLNNLRVQARRAGVDTLTAYRESARRLVERLLAFHPPRHASPRLLLLHASEHPTSNTLDLAEAVAAGLAGRCSIREISLRNGTVFDCRGCSYKTCAHFARSNACFYGGPIVDSVFPALLESDGLLLLCPNYNDALSANITAFINRLTALLVNNSLYDKYLYAIVVSGYSGGDLVAQQVLGALCLNKTFMLPPRFCLLETANDPGDALASPGIQVRTAAFGANMLSTMGPGPDWGFAD